MKLAEDESLMAFPEDKQVTGGGASVVSNLTTVSTANSVDKAVEVSSAKKKLAAERMENAKLKDEIRKLRRGKKQQAEKRAREAPTSSEEADKLRTQDTHQSRLINLASMNVSNEEEIEVDEEDDCDGDSATHRDGEEEGGDRDK